MQLLQYISILNVDQLYAFQHSNLPNVQINTPLATHASDPKISQLLREHIAINPTCTKRLHTSSLRLRFLTLKQFKKQSLNIEETDVKKPLEN